MKKNNVLSLLGILIPLFISGLLCIGLIYAFWYYNTSNPAFSSKLEANSNVFISISGFLAAIIMVYLAFSALGLKNNRVIAIDNLSKVTQKMHNFRNIIELLVRSKMWLPGLKEYIDEEFQGLTFFDVKEFYKGKSKLAIEFLQENHHYGDTENLYLELKSLLMTSPKDKKIPESIHYPQIYTRDIVEKWLEHKCSSGLWYYFGYKYSIYKDALDYNSVYERHQEKIMTLANSIDSEAFEDSSFNEVFLSKLGEYMSKEVMPKLYQFQGDIDQKLPRIIRYLYCIFLLLILFGIVTPLLVILFNLPTIILGTSYAFIISLIFFIATSFYHFLQSETKS